MTTEMNEYKAVYCGILDPFDPSAFKKYNTNQYPKEQPVLHLPQGLDQEPQPAWWSEDKRPLYPAEMTEVTLMVIDTLIMSNEVLDI